MDLVELPDRHVVRHPWEQSRVRALRRILRSAGPSRVQSILDYGCGDAYLGLKLRDQFRAERLVGVDLHLSEPQLAEIAAGDDRMELVNDASALRDRRFDLMLLCDVIEHVEDDQSILRLVKAHLTERGMALVTVPAFQALFTEHDRFLRHFRRYSLSGLVGSLERAGLRATSSGYLFGSLLIPRALQKAREAAFGPRPTGGLGDWEGGPVVTRILTEVLSAENAVWLGLSRSGVRVPGLSAWALCR